MENGEVTFNGMSSMNEYWSRASENDRSKIDTSSSDYSIDESNSSCWIEYFDASTYVDFGELTDEDATNVEEDSKNLIQSSESKNFIQSYESQKRDNVTDKSSRYVRWDVLVSLGIGLWMVLCIVDVFHSEKSATRDWVFEYLREKKNTSKIVSITEKPKAQVFEFSQLWQSLWRILWIFSSGGTYILLIVLLIVFCADPRLRRTVEQASVKNASKPRMQDERKVKNLSNVHQSRVNLRERSKTLTVARPVIHEIHPKLVLSPDIHLHAKILSDLDQRILYLESMRDAAKKKKTAIVPIVNSQKIIRSVKKNDIEGSMVNRNFFDVYRLRSTSGNSIRTITKKNGTSIIQFSATSYMRDKSTSTLSFNIQFHIDEYLRNTRKSLDTLNYQKSIEQIESIAKLTINRNTKTRIITSSPAFKNFLLRFRHNSCVT